MIILMMFDYIILAQTVPVFSISPSDAVVSEDDGFVEICVDLEIFTLGRSVVVTATTEAKLGASNVATGTKNRIPVKIFCITNIINGHADA